MGVNGNTSSAQLEPWLDPIGSNLSTLDGIYVPVQNVDPAQNFTASTLSDSRIDLSWLLNNNNDNVIIAFSTNSNFGSPSDGLNYSVGDQFAGGGEVLYYGSLNSLSHIGLTSGTTYYYKIWSHDGIEYSSALLQNTTTNCLDVTRFPFSRRI